MQVGLKKRYIRGLFKKKHSQIANEADRKQEKAVYRYRAFYCSQEHVTSGYTVTRVAGLEITLNSLNISK
jgi:hypothetical protein